MFIHTQLALNVCDTEKKRRTSLCYTPDIHLSHSISRNSFTAFTQCNIPSVPSAQLHDHCTEFGVRSCSLCRRSSQIPDALELLRDEAPGIYSAKVFYPKCRRLRLCHRALDKLMSQTWFQIHTETAVGHESSDKLLKIQS